MIRTKLITRRPQTRGRSIGPRDEGRVLTEKQYLRCVDAPGYVSEIFDGVIHVSPSPIPTHGFWENRLYECLADFAAQHSGIFNYVNRDNDVVIKARPGVTRPRPDVTAYRDFPSLDELTKKDDWSFFCPVLVVEIVSRRRRKKDIERNRGLYWAAGGISEYWIVDPSKDPRRPTLTVLVREAGRTSWTEHRFAFGGTYRSTTLGGLKINLRELAAGK